MNRGFVFSMILATLSAASVGAQRLELANSQYYSWALENRNALLPTQAQRDEAASIAREARERYRGVMEIVFVQADYLTTAPKACMGGWARTYMCVTPSGEVLPCHAAHIIPNLHFDNVATAVAGDNLERLSRIECVSRRCVDARAVS